MFEYTFQWKLVAYRNQSADLQLIFVERYCQTDLDRVEPTTRIILLIVCSDICNSSSKISLVIGITCSTFQAVLIQIYQK